MNWHKWCWKCITSDGMYVAKDKRYAIKQHERAWTGWWDTSALVVLTSNYSKKNWPFLVILFFLFHANAYVTRSQSSSKIQARAAFPVSNSQALSSTNKIVRPFWIAHLFMTAQCGHKMWTRYRSQRSNVQVVHASALLTKHTCRCAVKFVTLPNTEQYQVKINSTCYA